MTFRIKNKKPVPKNPNDTNFTLDVKHQEIMEKFHKQKAGLPNKRKQLELLFTKQKSLEQKIMNDNENIFMYQTELSKVNQTIQELSKEIHNIENDVYEQNYFLNTSHILFEYYDESKANVLSSPSASTGNPNTLDFFFQKDSIASSSAPIKSNKIVDYIDKKDRFNKFNLLDEYLSIVDESYLNKDNHTINPDICLKCNNEMNIIKNEGLMVCNLCGIVQRILIDSDKPCYKEPPPENNYFAYKRINHFNECLSQFQARETTEIPEEVYEKILIEIKKERINNMADVTQKKLKEYLKKLGLNKYYEHIPHILYKLNGISPPVIPKEIEETLRNMFKEIQGPFMKVCPKDRKNFLSYSYVLYKLIELLDFNDLKKHFSLLKSREKLYQQDLIWKKICEEVNWQFIKSI